LISAALTLEAVAGFDLKPEYYSVKEFRLQSGALLRGMKIEYATHGTPKVDNKGDIINAVVFCHGWSGNYSQINLLEGIIGPGKPLDPNQFFIVCPTALGSPGSSCPSVSGLGPRFPKYTIGDMVSAQYALVTEHLNIKRLAGVIGASMGGHQTLQWITTYPGFMEWAIAIATGPATTGRNVGVWGLMSQTIAADPAYLGGKYTKQPREGLRRAFMGTYMFYFTHAYFQRKSNTADEVLKGLEDAGLGSEKMDANDIIWRNHAMLSFDVRPELPKVKAATLIIGVNSDELFPPHEEFLQVAYGIPGAKVFAFDSIYGHVGCALDIGKAREAVTEFLRTITLIDRSYN
jgi:homoserine O-acetyltransferase